MRFHKDPLLILKALFIRLEMVSVNISVVSFCNSRAPSARLFESYITF
jgi:hypothetical protein